MFTTILIGLGTVCLWFALTHIGGLLKFLLGSGFIGLFILTLLVLWIYTPLGLISITFILLGAMVLFGHLIGAHK